MVGLATGTGIGMKTLDALRAERRLTREQLMVKTGGTVATSTIYRIERRDVVPEWETQDALARALDVAVDTIDWPTEAEVAPKREQRKQQQQKGGDAQ